MKDGKLIRIGSVGAVVAAICCFTPVVVLALGLVGLAAWAAWADYVLFPALAFFLALTTFGFYIRRRNRAAGAACCDTAPGPAR